MTTGTPSNHKQYRFTIILLCIGYFIDFYDLTIFSASYTNIIGDLFHITDINQVQLLYLKITNYHTAGIIAGGLLFGILGDKFGRTSVIRYSILLYSMSITLSCFVTNIPLFIFLRFLAGAGLASEFATSSVLISEMLPQNQASRATAWLYIFGILGGITATFLGVLSWKIMFLFGGVSGFILYIMRRELFESPLFVNMHKHINKGNPYLMFNSYTNIKKTLSLAILITPFYYLICIMFIIPAHMHLGVELSDLIHTLLIGFFAGNLISTYLSHIWVNKVKDFRSYFIINSILFGITLSLFMQIPPEYFMMYAIILGLLGGGLPTIWIQMVAKSYGTNQRNTATNTLYVIGRGTSILFNIIISYWLSQTTNFVTYCIMTTIIIMIVSIIVAYKAKNLYIKDIDYVE